MVYQKVSRSKRFSSLIATISSLSRFRRVKICQSFCDELYKQCKTAEFNGNIISTLYKSSSHFCEANNFNVVTNDCFAFDGSVFSSTPISTVFNRVSLCLVSLIGFFFAR